MWLSNASGNLAVREFRTSSKNLVLCFSLTLFLTKLHCIVADVNSVSRELSLHPVHLTPDNEGNLPPSALVPFCSYQENSSLLGMERHEIDNITMCDKFQPTIFEGQLCYSVDIAKLKGKSTKSGKTNGLFLLLDPNPYQLNSSDKDDNIQSMKLPFFKVHIHTLAQFTAYGPGTFSMSGLKRMTGTKSFKQLPDKQKQARKLQDAQAEKLTS